MGLIFLYLLEDYAKNTALNFLIVNELDDRIAFYDKPIRNITNKLCSTRYEVFLKNNNLQKKKTRPRFLNVEDAWEWCFDNWVKRDRQTNCLV